MTSPDIVYFLGEDLPDNGRELRYSLRSLDSLPHGDVWLVAPDPPDWVQEVYWVPWEQLPAKQLDISEKYKWLVHLGDESSQAMTDNVVVMDDDYYIIKPMREVPLIYNMPMAAKAQTRPHPSDEMGIMLRSTYRLLLANFRTVPLAAVLHVPFPITRSNMPIHLEDGRGPYEWKTIYLNWAMSQGVRGKSSLIDPKITEEQDIALTLEYNDGFMSTMQHVYDELGMDEILNDLFPEKSRHER